MIKVTTKFKEKASSKVVSENVMEMILISEPLSHLANVARFIKSCFGNGVVFVSQDFSIRHEKESDAPMHPDHERNQAPGY